MKNNKATIASKFRILILLVIVATLSLGVYMNKGVEVSLNVDGKEFNIVSYTTTVGDFIQVEDIEFKTGAQINVPLEGRLEDNKKIIIKNLKSYSIDDNGLITKVKSAADTVEDVLKDTGIELGEKDYTYPELSQKIVPGDTIKLFRFRDETIIEEVVVEYETISTINRDLDIGTKKIIQQGMNGLEKRHRYKIYVNDILVVSKIVETEVLEEVSDHIIEKG